MDKIATVKIVNELNVIISGLTALDINYFFEKYGVYVKGYFFNPLFKLNKWDGKFRYFSKTGKTYYNLLPEIIPSLKNLGYKLKLIDERKYFNINVPEIDKTYFSNFIKDNKPLELGEHQVLAINTLTQNNGGIVVGGTGSGKSIAIAALVELYGKHQKFKCIIIVPTKDLVKQMYNDLIFFNLDVGVYYGENKDIEHQHLVSTWQSLKNNSKLLALYNTIIVDECHGSSAKVLRDLIIDAGINCPIRIGVTGTLPKDPCEFMNVRICLGKKLYEIPASELMDTGWLAKLKIQMYQLTENLVDQWQSFQIEHPEEASKLTYKKFKNEYFPDYKAELKYLKMKDKRTEFIASMIEIARSKGNCLVLVEGISYGKKMVEFIKDSYFVYGKDDTDEREKVYKLFSEHDDIVVIGSSQLMSTGLNIPRIFNLFLIDQGKSFVRIIQSIGRGLRKAEDKDSVVVYDICSDFGYAATHMNLRKKYYKEQKYEFQVKQINYSDIC